MEKIILKIKGMINLLGRGLRINLNLKDLSRVLVLLNNNIKHLKIMQIHMYIIINLGKTCVNKNIKYYEDEY